MKTLTARLLRIFLFNQNFTCIINGVAYNNDDARELLKSIDSNQEVDFKETGTLQLTFSI